jgi:hypothetical protein
MNARYEYGFWWWYDARSNAQLPTARTVGPANEQRSRENAADAATARAANMHRGRTAPPPRNPDLDSAAPLWCWAARCRKEQQT